MNETLDLGTNESIFGKIKFIAGNDVTAETKASAEEMGDLMNTHVVFEAPDQLILGEVDEVNDGFIKIRLLGEFHEGKYVSGVIRKPVMNSLIRLINNEELNAIVGVYDETTFKVGRSSIYKDYEVCKNKTTLAKKYNVSDALIGEIVRGVRWSRTYKEYYGKASEYKKPKRKKLSKQILKTIIYEYYVNNKDTVEIEKLTGVTNGYISKIVRGIVYSKEVNHLLLEIKKELDNQQPNS